MVPSHLDCETGRGRLGRGKGKRGRLGREGFGGGGRRLGREGLRGWEVSDLGFWEGEKGKAGGRRGLESGKVI
jgi:hypothetical protein